MTGSMRKPGFIIDVPITLSVSVRGVPRAEAMRIARKFADDLEPSCHYVKGYSDALTGDAEITEVSLESSREETCSVLEELEEESE